MKCIILLGAKTFTFSWAKQDLASDSFTFSRCWCKGVVTSGPLSSWKTAYQNSKRNEIVSCLNSTLHFHGFPGNTSGKELTCQCRRLKTCRFNPWVGKIPWRRAWQPTPVFLPGECSGQRSLAGYSPRGHKQLDMAEVT